MAHKVYNIRVHYQLAAAFDEFFHNRPSELARVPRYVFGTVLLEHAQKHTTNELRKAVDELAAHYTEDGMYKVVQADTKLIPLRFVDNDDQAAIIGPYHAMAETASLVARRFSLKHAITAALGMYIKGKVALPPADAFFARSPRLAGRS